MHGCIPLCILQPSTFSYVIHTVLQLNSCFPLGSFMKGKIYWKHLFISAKIIPKVILYHFSFCIKIKRECRQNRDFVKQHGKISPHLSSIYLHSQERIVHCELANIGPGAVRVLIQIKYLPELAIYICFTVSITCGFLMPNLSLEVHFFHISKVMQKLRIN